IFIFYNFFLLTIYLCNTFFRFIFYILFFYFVFFFFNDTATTEIYTLSLHDALPICITIVQFFVERGQLFVAGLQLLLRGFQFFVDRKSTRLNSSHVAISYAVFCLKKKKTTSSLYLTALQHLSE